MSSALISTLNSPRSPMRRLNWPRPASRSAATMSPHTAASSCSRSARRERLDAGLAELARMRPVGAARLIAERRAAVAIARRRVAARVPLQMQAAGRHREVGAQAQLRAVGIGEHIGARPQRLAHHVEEQARRLDHGRRDALVARPRERAPSGAAPARPALRHRRGWRWGTWRRYLAAILPLPACGERVGVRGGHKCWHRSELPPLTLTLSPLKNGERG